MNQGDAEDDKTQLYPLPFNCLAAAESRHYEIQVYSTASALEL